MQDAFIAGAKFFASEISKKCNVSWHSEQLNGNENKSAEWRSKNIGYGSKCLRENLEKKALVRNFGQK